MRSCGAAGLAGLQGIRRADPPERHRAARDDHQHRRVPRADTGALVLSVADVELLRLLRSVAAGMAEEAAAAGGAALELEPLPGTLAIRADEHRLRQMLRALLGHALKSIRGGRARAGARAAAARRRRRGGGGGWRRRQAGRGRGARAQAGAATGATARRHAGAGGRAGAGHARGAAAAAGTPAGLIPGRLALPRRCGNKRWVGVAGGRNWHEHERATGSAGRQPARQRRQGAQDPDLRQRQVERQTTTANAVLVSLLQRYPILDEVDRGARIRRRHPRLSNIFRREDGIGAVVHRDARNAAAFDISRELAYDPNTTAWDDLLYDIGIGNLIVDLGSNMFTESARILDDEPRPIFPEGGDRVGVAVPVTTAADSIESAIAAIDAVVGWGRAGHVFIVEQEYLGRFNPEMHDWNAYRDRLLRDRARGGCR